MTPAWARGPAPRRFTANDLDPWRAPGTPPPGGRFRPSLGPGPRSDGRCRFRVWAPDARRVDLCLLEPRSRRVEMVRQPRGYWSVTVDDAPPGTLYRYRLNGEGEFPDPASRHQPDGVHGPSRVVDDEYRWTSGPWSGAPLRDHILYEIHVGAFSEAGTFDGVIAGLEHLERLGVTTLQLMPVAQFPGERNWGYDGVYPWAVQHSYGGPEGLKRLVDACHDRGLAVILDVVYNHLGPEGCPLRAFGPYFTERYRTPWGAAINFDGPGSGEVRRFFLESALRWITEFRVDGLRLDALDAIVDSTLRTSLRSWPRRCTGRRTARDGAST